jgi:hypothetical protein
MRCDTRSTASSTSAPPYACAAPAGLEGEEDSPESPHDLLTSPRSRQIKPSPPCSPHRSAIAIGRAAPSLLSAAFPSSSYRVRASYPFHRSSSTPPHHHRVATPRHRRPGRAAAGILRPPHRRRPCTPPQARTAPKIVCWRYVVAVGPSPGEVRPPPAFNSAIGDEQFRPRTTLLLPCSFQGDFHNPGTSA